jgi:hypothetical protein
VTHSLHRLGEEQSLEGDYVLLCTPATGINTKGAREKLQRALDILMEVGPANIGFYGFGSAMTGIRIEDVRESLGDHSRLRCCFDKRENVEEALRRLQAEDLGISVTVSSMMQELAQISHDLGLTPHTIHMSCGIFGRLDRLPAREILEITTMCGHGMIAHGLAAKVVDKLKQGEIEIHEAVRTLGEPCTCGIFNPTRARELLQRIVQDA